MPRSSQPARIDRLRIDVPGGTAGQARDLARLVAAGLADAGALPQAGDLPSLHVSVQGDAKDDPVMLARRIVAATLRALACAP